MLLDIVFVIILYCIINMVCSANTALRYSSIGFFFYSLFTLFTFISTNEPGVTHIQSQEMASQLN